jgi:hypothetical protein
MADGFDRQQFATALQGLGAGLTGQLPQFLEQRGRQEARDIETSKLALAESRKSENARRTTLFQDSQRGLELARNGRWDRLSQLANTRLDLLANQFPEADPTDTQQFALVANAAAGGDPAAQQAALFKLQENTNIGIDTGILDPPKAPKQQIVKGNLVTFGPGITPTIEKIEGLSETDSAEVQSSKVLDNGTLIMAMKDGSRVVRGPEGKILKGKKAAEAIKAAQVFGAEIQGLRAESRSFSSKTGASRAKAIDTGFANIQKIDAGIANFDRAISAIQSGAGTGAIEKFLPSFKAASVLLDNIQGSMALDVVGATTFGALSKGELDLARAVALPTGLDGPELIQFLNDKKAAQSKLRGYYFEQIQFLDQGGTVAGFLRRKEGEQGQQPQVDQQAGQQRNITVDF